MLDDSKLGIPPSDAVPTLQTDAFKELINKIAWAVGSSYRVPYRNPRTGARNLAIDIARALIDGQGYPRQIAAPRAPDQLSSIPR